MTNNNDNLEHSDDLPYADKNVGNIDVDNEITEEVPELSEQQKRKYKNRVGDTPMKPFRETALGRTLAGRNKFGRFVHSVIDVLPVPNVHEVVKAVIKDADDQQKAIGTFELIKQTFQRLDYFRTAVGIGLVVLYLLDYISLDKASQAFEFILSFI